jgi:hypothetical protein
MTKKKIFKFLINFKKKLIKIFLKKSPIFHSTDLKYISFISLKNVKWVKYSLNIY